MTGKNVSKDNYFDSEIKSAQRIDVTVENDEVSLNIPKKKKYKADIIIDRFFDENIDLYLSDTHR